MIAQNHKNFIINHIVDQLTDFIVQDYNLDLASALKIVYGSNVYTQLQETELELFTQSPSYIYELLKNENSLQLPSSN